MQCQESKKILDAYVDNEVDVPQSVALEEHLADCADCHQMVENRQALKKAIHSADLRYQAPPELMRDVRKAIGFREEKPARLKAPWFRSMAFGFAAAAAVCAVAVIATMLWMRGQSETRMAGLVIEDHVRSMMVEHLVDVKSSDQHTVKPWFNGKVSFSPKVTDFKDNGFPLEGGRLDRLDNHDVAALVYQRYKHIINVFEYPASNSFGEQVKQERGYNVLHWSKDGMEYWTISDLNLAELEQFAELLRQ